MRNRIWLTIIVMVLFVAYVMSFNYGGCGNGKSGSSKPKPPAQVTSPTPANSATNVPITQHLRWVGASGVAFYEVYLGIVNPPSIAEFKAAITNTAYTPGTLNTYTTYYWRVDTKNSIGTTTGAVWSFTTNDGRPDKVTWHDPRTGATSVPLNYYLTWGSVTGATSYDVYFGTITTNWTAPITTTMTLNYKMPLLTLYTTYYWRIDPKNQYGTTTGDVWNFNTGDGSLQFEASGGSGWWISVSGNWTANSNVSWIIITSGSSGTSGGKIIFTVLPNTGTSERTGAIFINGYQNTIIVELGATSSSSSSSSSFTYDGTYDCTITTRTPAGPAYGQGTFTVTNGDVRDTGGGTFRGTVDSNGNFTGTTNVGAGALPMAMTGIFSLTGSFTISGSSESGGVSQTIVAHKR